MEAVKTKVIPEEIRGKVIELRRVCDQLKVEDYHLTRRMALAKIALWDFLSKELSLDLAWNHAIDHDSTEVIPYEKRF